MKLFLVLMLLLLLTGATRTEGICLPLLVAPQQVTPMDIPVPSGHPGQKQLMLSYRDFLLVQMKAWVDGRELERDEACPGSKETCAHMRVHLEPEQGSDSETILLHAFYRSNGTKADEYLKSKADIYCADTKLFMGTVAPKWLKWERRDNNGQTQPLK